MHDELRLNVRLIKTASGSFIATQQTEHLQMPNTCNQTRALKHKSMVLIRKGSTSRLTCLNYLNYYLTFWLRSREVETIVFAVTLLCRQTHSSHYRPYNFLFWHRNSPRLERRNRNS